ncbi:hypothetical protein ACIOJE_29140 [Kitasatospora sp. NPDC087861]|uniref:hypothetical protein n=1 Tax=unclassified Kitasatospora TaxID=2633591 RepID=UPI0024732ACB|nr:hypothetical protein [Kitasatospora sp. MAA19]
MSKLGRRHRLTAVAAVAVLGGGFAVDAWLNQDPEAKVYEGPVAGQLLLVSSDGQTLTLSIGWGCEKQPELVARETAGTVKVSLRHTVPPGFCDPGGIGRITTHLNRPLGTRALNDATGKPVIHFDERNLLRPAFLPENYYPYPAGRMVELPGLAPLPTDTPAWASGYRLGTDPEQGSLIISQTLRNSTPPTGRATGVKGHPATITQPDPHDGPRSLTWSDGTYTFVVTTGGPPRLSDQELIHVAENLG